jgi:hypothetical protein
MPLHINKPLFHVENRRPELPQGILDSLLPRRQPEEFSNFHLPSSRVLREAARAKGLSPCDIVPLLNQGKNTRKTLGLIEDAMNGEKVHPSFLSILLKALDLTKTDLAAVDTEEKELLHRRRRDSVHRQVHNAYRNFGPYLYPMALINYRPSFLSITGDSYFYIKVPFEVVGESIVTPGLDQIPQLIRKPPEDSFFQIRHGRFGAVLYHRLPEEMAFFDLEGNLISQGDCSLNYPEGVQRFLY